MDPSFRGQKAALRHKILDKLSVQTDADRQRESAAIVSFLEDFAPRTWTVVLATLPMASEPNLVPFLTRWMDQGRHVALARTGPGRSLSFRYVASLEGPWDVKPYGMREPLETAAAWSPGLPTLALIPGLGFAAGPSGGRQAGPGGGVLRPLAGRPRERCVCPRRGLLCPVGGSGAPRTPRPAARRLDWSPGFLVPRSEVRG